MKKLIVMDFEVACACCAGDVYEDDFLTCKTCGGFYCCKYCLGDHDCEEGME